MHIRDLIMVLVSFSSMAAGVFLPQAALLPASTPRVILMFMLYMSFLAVGVTALWGETRSSFHVLVRLTLFRLIVLPLICFCIFRLMLPEFALSALLLGAAPVGVMAAVFSLMLKANTALILAGNIVTSLLLPISLPAVLSIIDKSLRTLGLTPLDLPEHFSLGDMSLSLAITILVPFAAAILTRKLSIGMAQGLLLRQFPLLTTAIALSNLAIFSSYADVLLQDPALPARALGAAGLLCIIMSLAAVPASAGMPRDIRLAFLISCGIINNILLMIISLEFFSVTEALTGAAYLVPLYILLFYYRRCSAKNQQ